MKKFNYTDWVTKNKHGKTLKESMYGDDATFGLAAKGLASKSDPSDNWNNLNVKQRTIILDQVPFLQDPNKQKALAPLSYDELMSKFPEEKERYMIDEAILDGLTDDEMKRTSEAFKENEEPTTQDIQDVGMDNLKRGDKLTYENKPALVTQKIENSDGSVSYNLDYWESYSDFFSKPRDGKKAQKIPSTDDRLARKGIGKTVRGKLPGPRLEVAKGAAVGFSAGPGPRTPLDPNLYKKSKETNSFGSRGSDKRSGQLIGDILQLIKSAGINPEEVIESIKKSFNL